MSTVVVYESMWGNTREVAEAVAVGLRLASSDDVQVVEVGAAPQRLPAELDLLVLGGPTHAFSMSRKNTRLDAAHRGAREAHEGPGVREWLQDVVPGEQETDVATFDTRVKAARHLPGSAAKAAGRQVERHHLGQLVARESFYVEDLGGPLLAGEVDRAQEWGMQLAARHSGVG